MGAKHEVKSTSWHSADVSDVRLSEHENEDGSVTRRILRPKIVDNPKNKDACVRACLMHQKRHSRAEPCTRWIRSISRTSRRERKSRLQLRSAETLRLYQNLQRLYAIGAKGVPLGRKTFESS